MKTAVIEYRYYGQKRDISNEDLLKNAQCKILVTNYVQNDSSDSTITLNHTNQGKDIGGKLIGIDYLLSTKQDIDTLILLHDKRSPHSPLGDFWFDELTKIFRPPYSAILKETMTKSNVGICCSQNYIKSEYDQASKQFNTNNNDLLRKLLKDYELHPPMPYSFVAGTIFCCKWDPLKTFFLKNDPLKIRSRLEKGNVQDMEQGTLTHSWERIFSWIITSQGYLIKGI